MEYMINKSGNRVVLNVLANAGKSLVGLQINNSKIISLHYSDLFDLVLAALGEREYNNLVTTLFKYHTLPVKNETGEEDDSIIVMETIEDSDHQSFFYETILETLKFYQSSDIFSCYLFSYRFIDGRIRYGGLTKMLVREHAIHWPYKPYEMTDESQREFKTWLDTHKEICGADQNDKFRQIKRLYLDSYLTDDASQSFVMLSVVLEMLFGGTVELNYRISRGAGVFLSSTRDEMKEIVKRVKQLYNIRSKYVHEGKRVEWGDLFELREIVRKTIVLMYEREMHRADFNFKEFSDEITYDGYRNLCCNDPNG